MAVPSLMPLTPPDPIDTQNKHPCRDLILLPRLMFSTGREWQGEKRKTGLTKTIPVAVLMVLPGGLLRGTDAPPVKRLHWRQGSTHSRNSDTPRSCQPSLGRSCPAPQLPRKCLNGWSPRDPGVGSLALPSHLFPAFLGSLGVT